MNIKKILNVIVDSHNQRMENNVKKHGIDLSEFNRKSTHGDGIEFDVREHHGEEFIEFAKTAVDSYGRMLNQTIELLMRYIETEDDPGVADVLGLVREVQRMQDGFIHNVISYNGMRIYERGDLSLYDLHHALVEAWGIDHVD